VFQDLILIKLRREKLADVLDLIEQQDSEHVYILATYTAMLEMREILANRHYVNGEMK
jgi:UDP-N-acetylmuramoyl-L-alanyl-D-glutamate--2,6-diaminopimelate ligase